MLGRPLRSADPVVRVTLQVHYGKYPNLIVASRIEHGIREPLAQPAADCAQNGRASLGVLDDRASAAPNFRKEGRAETDLFVLVILDRVVQLAFSKAVERDAHGLNSRLRVPKHVFCGPRRERPGVQRIGAALPLLRPDASVFLRREIFETIKQSAGQTSPGLGFEFQCRRLKFVDAHGTHSTPFFSRSVFGTRRPNVRAHQRPLKITPAAVWCSACWAASRELWIFFAEGTITTDTNQPGSSDLHAGQLLDSDSS